MTGTGTRRHVAMMARPCRPEVYRKGGVREVPGMDGVTEIMKQAEADLKEAETASSAAQSRAIAAQADADAARERVREMRAVRDWLQLHSPSARPPNQAERTETPPQTRFGKPVPEVSQTELCVRALESLGGTATNRQIRDRLARDGNDFNLDQIRGTLKYLSRKTPPPVETDAGSGLWRLRRVGTFVPAGTLPVNGAGGES